MWGCQGWLGCCAPQAETLQHSWVLLQLPLLPLGPTRSDPTGLLQPGQHKGCITRQGFKHQTLRLQWQYLRCHMRRTAIASCSSKDASISIWSPTAGPIGCKQVSPSTGFHRRPRWEWVDRCSRHRRGVAMLWLCCPGVRSTCSGSTQVRVQSTTSTSTGLPSTSPWISLRRGSLMESKWTGPAWWNTMCPNASPRIGNGWLRYDVSSPRVVASTIAQVTALPRRTPGVKTSCCSLWRAWALVWV